MPDVAAELGRYCGVAKGSGVEKGLRGEVARSRSVVLSRETMEMD